MGKLLTARRFLNGGGECRAMDLVVHSEAFNLGVKRSSIKLPWEREPLCRFFGKRPRLILPPTFVPAVAPTDDTVSLEKDAVEGKLQWSRRTSCVPWPIVQDRALARCLECWRIIIMDNLNGSLVGQQIARAMSGDPTATSVEQTISDALAGKSLGTLRARASSLMDFGRWKKGCAVNSTLLPITEEEAYLYVHELREHNAPRTKPARFVEALNFIYHMLGADVGNAMHSPRVKGATVVPFVVPKKKEPLSAAQVAFFERLAMTDAGQQGIIAGYVCMVLHMRLRWSDGQYCIDEPYTDLHCGHGFLECRLYHHKTAGRQKLSQRLLPAACVLPGITGEDWATEWLAHRSSHGLKAARGVPTLPAPLADGGWAMVPMESSQATSWLREMLKNLQPAPSMLDIGTHSLKATLLSMMAKAGCPTDLRRLAGYHTDPQARMALEYSRDSQAPVLHALEGIMMAIQYGLFDPDATRARRWPRRGCNSLELALAELSKVTTEQGWYNVQNVPAGVDSPELSDGWQRVDENSDGYSPSGFGECDSDGQVSISSASEPDDRPEIGCEDDLIVSEENQVDMAAEIVGQDLALVLMPQIRDVVFRHVISGCCHLARNSECDPSDGEAVILRCGKVATRNFEEVQLAGSFLPYKCTRCFTGD